MSLSAVVAGVIVVGQVSIANDQGGPAPAGDVSAYYIDIGTPPFGVDDYADAMDAVFGEGNWTHATIIDNVPTILADADFIYVEGSDNQAEDLMAWLNLYDDQLIPWVNGGGRLYVNSAPTEGGDFDLLFGATLLYPEFGDEGNAAIGHPIFNGPFTPITSNFTGDAFSHAAFEGAGTPVMENEFGQATLVEVNVDGGAVFYGGLVPPSMQEPQPESQNLLQNILAYVAFGPMIEPGDNAYFVSGDLPPWESDAYANAMDAVFGAGNWTSVTFDDDALAVMTDASFMYVEGSDESADELAEWLTSTSIFLEPWIEAGGNLYINSAPNVGDDLDFPFGVTCSYPDFGFEASAVIAHPIFDGPFTPVATEYIGNAFAHASLDGAATTIMENEGSDAVLAEGDPELQGRIVYGALTNPSFQLPQPDSQHLLQNIVAYVSGAEGGCLPDCDGDGDLTILDFVCYQNRFQAGDLAADCDGDGDLTILDFVCFQKAFLAGCP